MEITAQALHREKVVKSLFACGLLFLCLFVIPFNHKVHFAKSEALPYVSKIIFLITNQMHNLRFHTDK